MCLEDAATLTCDIPGATSLRWSIDRTNFIVQLDSSDDVFMLGERDPEVRGGIAFSFSLLPGFVSELRFVPDDRTGGVSVTCTEFSPGTFSSTITTTAIANSKS